MNAAAASRTLTKATRSASPPLLFLLLASALPLLLPLPPPSLLVSSTPSLRPVRSSWRCAGFSAEQASTAGCPAARWRWMMAASCSSQGQRSSSVKGMPTCSWPAV